MIKIPDDRKLSDVQRSYPTPHDVISLMETMGISNADAAAAKINFFMNNGTRIDGDMTMGELRQLLAQDLAHVRIDCEDVGRT